MEWAGKEGFNGVISDYVLYSYIVFENTECGVDPQLFLDEDKRFASYILITREIMMMNI